LNNIQDGETLGSWLNAIIILVHKKENIKHYYGGTNLLNSGCKLYTNIIKNKLYTYYKTKLGKAQDGFIMNTIKAKLF
jgi:hypothetical protein